MGPLISLFLFLFTYLSFFLSVYLAVPRFLVSLSRSLLFLISSPSPLSLTSLSPFLSFCVRVLYLISFVLSCHVSSGWSTPAIGVKRSPSIFTLTRRNSSLLRSLQDVWPRIHIHPALPHISTFTLSLAEPHNPTNTPRSTQPPSTNSTHPCLSQDTSAPRSPLPDLLFFRIFLEHL